MICYKRNVERTEMRDLRKTLQEVMLVEVSQDKKLFGQRKYFERDGIPSLYNRLQCLIHEDCSSAH